MDPDISAHYEEGAERSRLTESSPVEFVRTCLLLDRFLPPAPARVLDVGGGPGAYAAFLADHGYEVHLVDPVPLHVEQAREAARGRFSVATGDARALDQPDGSADAVLLFGPLYHLVDAADRAVALSEAVRVTRAGGVVLVAAINRYAGILDALAKEYLDADGQHAYGRQLLDSGTQHAADAPKFTTAYFHRAGELAAEMRAAGLDGVSVLGIEGFGGWMPDQRERISDPRRRALVLETARLLEDEPDVIGLSAHLMGIGHVPAPRS